MRPAAAQLIRHDSFDTLQTVVWTEVAMAVHTRTVLSIRLLT